MKTQVLHHLNVLKEHNERLYQLGKGQFDLYEQTGASPSAWQALSEDLKIAAMPYQK